MLTRVAKEILPSSLYTPLQRGYSWLRQPPVLTPKSGININFNKNEYKDKRCFMIGTAPSIQKMDLSPLKNEYTITVNKGYLLKEKGLNNVTFYGIIDKYAANDYGNEVPEDFARHYVTFGLCPFERKTLPNLTSLPIYTPKAWKKGMADGFFQWDINNPLAHGTTIMIYMLQVAVYAGFNEIYLIGIDNNFSGKELHFYQSSLREIEQMTRYKKDPTINTSIALGRAHLSLKKRNITLANAGLGGDLNSIPRVNFNELFQ